MAPSLLTLVDRAELVTRQTMSNASTTPTCVSDCMSQGPTGTCRGVTDYACTCASTEYIGWVSQCWAKKCSLQDAAFGKEYAERACAFYGVPINNGTGSSNGTTPSTGVPNLAPPMTTSPTFLNIQAVMSSICTALMVLALLMGFISCRARVKADQMASQNRTWNGVTGTTQMDAKAPKPSRFFKGMGSGSKFANNRNDMTQIQSDTFGVTSSNFGGTTTLTGGPEREPGYRFTNRLTLGQLQARSRSEEWELSDVVTPIKEEGSVDHKSPTTPTTIGSMMGAEVDLGEEGSTIHLNVLPKERARSDEHHAT
ncbi:hypothetical protein IAU60_001711 [Kwoniella sp. DSM 27419]